MAEIESAYGEDTPAASESSRKRSARRNEEEEVKQETFETGFDHGFENMATFNGRSVGNEKTNAAASESTQA